VTASPQHTDYLKSLGADHVIDRNLDTPSLIGSIRKVLPGGSTRFLYDTVSSVDTQNLGLELLATGGRMVYVVPGSGAQPTDGKEVVLVKGSPYLPVNKELVTALYSHLGQLLETGSIKVWFAFDSQNILSILPFYT
jgi:NADPH:quinone reductase-like Zn-dependent oxidoreductase